MSNRREKSKFNNERSKRRQADDKRVSATQGSKNSDFFLSYFIFVLGFLLCDSFCVQFSQHREKQRKMRGGSR